MLLVVLHHIKLPYLSAGFLGVDIFFVISGFLITGLIANGMARGEFSFKEFYYRRARRLLPAAYVTLFVSALLAPWILNAVELRDFAFQLAGALTFTGNFVLWQQTDYFKSASELKPLLHVWSLAVEEQYYFVLPALLAVVARRRWLVLLAALTFFSLALCAAGAAIQPVATFYLFPTRAWEMGIGSLGALLIASGAAQRWARALFWPALALVAVLPFVPIKGAHPGPAALLACCATLVVILRQHPMLNSRSALGALAYAGDRSYSLYLVHWPVIAFANNAWVGETAGELPAPVMLGALLLSFALAWALHRWVEEPMRHRKVAVSRPALLRAVAASCVLLIMAAGIVLFRPAERADYAYLHRGNYGLDRQCEQGAEFSPLAACRTSARPRMLVWGDSYAMHLAPGLAAERGAELIQATRSLCGPLLGVAPIALAGSQGFQRGWSTTCISFNDSVLRYLAKTPSIEVVVLSSPLFQYLDGEKYRALQRTDGGLAETAPDAELAFRSLAATAAAVQKLGKRVVLVAPPPNGGFNAAACHERRAEGRLMFGAPDDCQIAAAQYHAKRHAVRSLLQRLEDQAGIPVFRFDAALCTRGVCRTDLDGVTLYRDAGHLSYAGSALLAERLDMTRQLIARAR